MKGIKKIHFCKYSLKLRAHLSVRNHKDVFTKSDYQRQIWGFGDNGQTEVLLQKIAKVKATGGSSFWK